MLTGDLNSIYKTKISRKTLNEEPRSLSNKMCDKDSVIQQMQNRKIDEWKEIDCQETEVNTYGNLIYVRQSWDIKPYKKQRIEMFQLGGQ